MSDTANLIEVLNSNGSQVEKQDNDTTIYSGYKFHKQSNQWLWCRIQHGQVELHFLGTAIEVKSVYLDKWNKHKKEWMNKRNARHINAGQWDYDLKQWQYTDQLDLEGESISNWVASVCTRSIDGNTERKASVKLDSINFVGLDAIKWFQSMFKILNDKQSRIDMARVLYPNTPDENLYGRNKQGEIVSVKVDRYELLNAYLMDAYINRVEFGNLQEWYMPQRGIFSNKKRKR